MTLATINKDKFFRGGANIAPDPDAGKELGELIYDIQVAVNLVENGIVDGDFAGTALGRLTRTGAGAYAVIQDNLAAAVAPVVGDDNTGGYGIGSLWFDTTAHRLYTCTDASTGAAIWIGQLAKNNVAATAPAVGDDDADGYSVGSMWTDTVTAIIWVCQSAATGAAVWNPIVKSNFAGAADPAVGDDDADGYAVGSIWVNTTAVPPRAFRCVNPATGAAVWRQLSAQSNLAAAVAPVVGDDDTAGYDVGSLWLDTTAYRMYVCTDASTGVAIWVGGLAKNNVAGGAPSANDDHVDGYSVGSMWTDTVTAIIWVCQNASTGAAVWNPIVKCNFAGAADPAVGDDDADGYAVGSIWVNTTAVPPRAFRCVNPATGAAVWRQLTAQSNLAAAAGPTVNDDVTGGYDVGSLWLDTTAHRMFVCTDSTTGAAIWIGPSGKNGGAGTAPTVNDDDSLGYSAGSFWVDGVTGIMWACQSAATGAAVWNPLLVKCNFAAAVGPAVGDDDADGYAVGSIWIDTTAVPPTVFRCVDPATGAAVWRQLNAQSNVAAAAAPAVGNDDTEGYDVGSVWLDTTADIAYICLDNATGAAVWRVLAARQIVENYQGAAATATLRVFRALVAGHITHAAAETGTVAAAAEDMTFDVQIGGVTCLTGVITVDNGVAVDTPVAGVIDVAANDFAVGDLISVVRTYTAGGAPTPMRDTAIGIEIQAD